jgi:hypothetical protein
MHQIIDMEKIDKTFALTLILIIAMSCLTLLIVNPTSAQTIPIPSVPRFDLKFQDNSYWVNSTQHIQNQTIQIKIENQPVGNSEYLLYLIDIKSHYEDKWNSTGASIWEDTQSQATLISYALEGNNASSTFNGYLEFSIGDTVDFRVQTELLHYLGPPDGSNIQSGYLKEVYRSDWSNTQTIIIPEGSISSSPNPTQTSTTTLTPTSTPTTPGTSSDSTNSITLPLNIFVAIIVVTAVVVSIAVALLAQYFSRHRAKINSQATSP